MADYVKKALGALATCITYPRSVFDLRPIDRGHFVRRSVSESLAADWRRIGSDLRHAALEVYGNA